MTQFYTNTIYAPARAVLRTARYSNSAVVVAHEAVGDGLMEEVFREHTGVCNLVVRQTKPDGFIYVLLNGPGRIIRLVPSE